MGLQPPVIGGQPYSLHEGDRPVRGRKWVNGKSEDGFFYPRGTICDTITCDASNPITKSSHQIPQDHQLKWVIYN